MTQARRWQMGTWSDEVTIGDLATFGVCLGTHAVTEPTLLFRVARIFLSGRLLYGEIRSPLCRTRKLRASSTHE